MQINDSDPIDPQNSILPRKPHLQRRALNLNINIIAINHTTPHQCTTGIKHRNRLPQVPSDNIVQSMKINDSDPIDPSDPIDLPH